MTASTEPTALEAIHSTPTDDVEPTRVALTASGVRALSEEHLRRAAMLLEQLRALDGAPDEALTAESVLLPLDRMYLELTWAGAFAGLMAETHPDEAVRESARSTRPQIVQAYDDIILDEALARVLRRLEARGLPIVGTRRRLLVDTLRELRRNGLELPLEGRAELRRLNDELSKASQDFSTHLARATGELWVEASRLRGLPQAFLEAHPAGPDGRVRLTTDYPDYLPVAQYADDRALARELNALFENRARDENLPLLERVLELRRQKARLLGHATWADFALEPRMARTADTVRRFLDEAARVIREPAAREIAELRAEYDELAAVEPTLRPLGPDDRIPAVDRLYLENRVRARRFGYDPRQLSEYLEVRAVVDGALALVAELFGLELADDSDAPRWHPDVRVIALREGGGLVGHLYLDLHPREGKYKHAAMFDVRPAFRRLDGRPSAPAAALVCNFPQPGETPALLSHDELTTFFHELGHALHHVLSREELLCYSGTNTARDYVEVPSQALEEWCFQREVLDRFARHHATGAPLPDELFRGLLASRSFGRALATERQLALARLDFEYHVREEPFDTIAVFHQVMARAQSFAVSPDSHFPATFGHLMGYDAAYYGYQWALAYARDVLSRFDAAGYLNPAEASRYRRLILERGAGEDEHALLTEYLGRPPSLEAYARHIAGG